ncbi:NACHT and WD domain-containing protein [Cordyceps javanica]|uniref:GPI inositol-deacylase n=1 Tax=Cordyceps javanica TaxID=43265 RepID=A0A545W753_9HYPO|nr:NACHT and WD domain-containing protein [Cordyceps javanica]TQW09746.1 NACHT and WD domain protein [Cordyceps javanica]
MADISLSETAATADTLSNRSAAVVSSSADYESCSSADDFDWKSTNTARKRFTTLWARRRRHEKSDAARQLGPKGLSLLHRPPEPLIDIIFVHGLRGGSVKTWQKGGDPQRFWPQLWLSVEPGFEHASIHSFGYDADIKTGSAFNLHDFGRELLEEMRISPHLTDNEERPIIMLGHSMGGLVIKKTFILAQDIPSWKHRIRSIFFLATPHRGSNYAAILKNILTVSGAASTRQYIGDLTTSSQALKLINEDFGKRSGFRNERVKSAAANHCDISKFKNPEEPNYTMVRNALAAAAKDLLKDILVVKANEARTQMKTIKPYLGISDVPDEHHDTVEGSCEWIEARDDFQDWRDMAGPNPKYPVEESAPGPKNVSIFWVHAGPGSGKTHLASYVQSQLESTNLQCAYYYFHVGNQMSRSLAPFLRSIAYQMAVTSTAVRDKLYKMYQDGSIFDMDDAWTIWTKVFKKGILQML